MRRIRGVLVMALGLFSLFSAGASFSLAQQGRSDARQEQPPVQEEPKDEASLWKRAVERMDHGNFLQAAADLERLLKEYPKSTHAVEAQFRLAGCDNSRGKPAEALVRYSDFVAANPQSKYASISQLCIAQILRNQNRKDDAKAAFKKLFKEYPGEDATQQGMWQYWNLVEKSFQFGIHQSYTDGQEVVVNATLRNIDKIAYRLYRLDPQALIKKIEAGAVFQSVQELVAGVPPAGRTTIKEWNDEPGIGRRGKNVQVKPEIKEPGLYVMEAEHDEIAVQVGIVVARYGLIVKSGANKSVVFAVDRRVGRAVEGMVLKFNQGKDRFEGKTNEEGVFVLEKGLNGTVVGIKDGELALSNLYSSASGNEMKAYLFTDRPIYRPNQTVQFKVSHREIIRKAEKDGLPAESFANVTARKGTLTIQDPRGNVVYQKEHTTNEFGSFNGEFRLGDEPPLGHYSMYSSLGGYGQFRVEEYRKPEYEVGVKFQGAPYLQGDDLKAEVSVDYYFGSPVVAADVSYEVRRAPYYKAYWRGWYSQWDFDGDEDDDNDGDEEVFHGKRGRYYAPHELITKGTGTTDAKGKLKIQVPSKRIDQDSLYTVTAKVVDKSRREVSGQASAKVTRAQIELGVSASRYVYTPGDRVSIKVRAADMDGKPVADQNLDITASTSKYWRRDKEAGYEYGDFYTGASKTDANGIAEFSFDAEKEGYIRLHVTTKDRRDNVVVEDSWIWVSGRAWSATFQNFTGLDVIPDKSSFAVGETAKVLITSQHASSHALFTVECEGIYRHQVVTLKGHSTLVEVPLDVARYAPNVFFSVATLVGGELLQKSKSISVVPAERMLNIKIAMDQEKYRPRENATVTVEVTDSKGAPVRAELSVGMVDESIYALQAELAPDIRKFFFAKRWNQVSTNSSMEFYDYGRAGWGFTGGKGDDKDGARRELGNAPGDPMAKSARGHGAQEEKLKEGGGMAETEVRGNFPDTMAWHPNAVTDAAGKFTFKTAVPDSLTTWRTTVRGMTADTKIGQKKHEVIVRKEVIVRLEAPRFFTQKDQCIISAIVHNYRDDVDEVQVVMSATGVEIEGAPTLQLKVAKGEDKRVDWKVTALKAGEAKLTVKALTPKESDAMVLSVPVLPHGMLRFESKAGLAEGPAKVGVTLPATAIREASEMTIVVAPSVASQITGALEYLAGYPYGCVEQTMSRFLPSVVAGKAMQQLGVQNEKLARELPDMVASGSQRLYNFQQSDGGWGWWHGDKSHPFMTAYVMYGLAKAREADFFIDPNVFQRGVNALQGMVKARTSDKRKRYDEQPLDTRAYLVFALAEAGVFEKEAIQELFEKRTELTDYAKALIAITLARSNRLEDSRTVLANLDETAKQGESFCYWEGSSQRWHWMSQSIETTAYVLRAYVLAAPKDAKIHKVVRWLAVHRQGNRWNSTKDTAAIVYALTDYVKASGELDADYTLKVKVNGREILAGRATKENLLSFDGTRVIRGVDIPAGAQEITFEKEGKGTLYYSVHLKYFDAAETFKPTEGTVTIDRSYSLVRWEGKTRETEPLQDGDTIRSGDIVEVTVKLNADGVHEYMMIEDPIPAGFEVQKEERFHGNHWGGRWGWWYSRIEARDDKVCVAATTMNGGQTFTYLMRAESPGDFRVLPTRAFNMYVPEIAGSGSGMRIKVKDKE